MADRCIHERYNDMEEYYYCDITGNMDFEPCTNDEDCFVWR